jgi:hypothetical protein
MLALVSLSASSAPTLATVKPTLISFRFTPMRTAPTVVSASIDVRVLHCVHAMVKTSVPPAHLSSLGLAFSTQCLKIRSQQKNWTLGITSTFVNFGKIRQTFDWRGVCTVKIQKTKNQPNLPISQTELVKIQSDSSKIRWNSRGYRSLKKN